MIDSESWKAYLIAILLISIPIIIHILVNYPRCGKWYFANENKVDENDERVDDSSLDLKNLEEEMSQLEDDIKKSSYRSDDKLCRLLNSLENRTKKVYFWTIAL